MSNVAHLGDNDATENAKNTNLTNQINHNEQKHCNLSSQEDNICVYFLYESVDKKRSHCTSVLPGSNHVVPYTLTEASHVSFYLSSQPKNVQDICGAEFLQNIGAQKAIETFCDQRQKTLQPVLHGFFPNNKAMISAKCMRILSSLQSNNACKTKKRHQGTNKRTILDVISRQIVLGSSTRLESVDVKSYTRNDILLLALRHLETQLRRVCKTVGRVHFVVTQKHHSCNHNSSIGNALCNQQQSLCDSTASSEDDDLDEDDSTDTVSTETTCQKANCVSKKHEKMIKKVCFVDTPEIVPLDEALESTANYSCTALLKDDTDASVDSEKSVSVLCINSKSPLSSSSNASCSSACSSCSSSSSWSLPPLPVSIAKTASNRSYAEVAKLFVPPPPPPPPAMSPPTKTKKSTASVSTEAEQDRQILLSDSEESWTEFKSNIGQTSNPESVDDCTNSEELLCKKINQKHPNQLDGWECDLEFQFDDTKDNNGSSVLIENDTTSVDNSCNVDLQKLHVESQCIPTITNEQHATYPKNVLLQTNKVMLAHSPVRSELQVIAQWYFNHLVVTNPLKQFKQHKIDRNFSAKECKTLRAYVLQCAEQGINVFVSIQCEFEMTPDDNGNQQCLTHSLMCTTLLNEYDGLTTELICDFLNNDNVTLVFQTHKSFNQVWCNRLNVINPTSSQWHQVHLAGADARQQKEAQIKATINMIQKMEYPSLIDYVALGECSDIGQQDLILDHFATTTSRIVDRKTIKQRWAQRIKHMGAGDACLIVLSESENKRIARLTTQAERFDQTHCKYLSAHHSANLNVFGQQRQSSAVDNLYKKDTISTNQSQQESEKRPFFMGQPLSNPTPIFPALNAFLSPLVERNRFVGAADNESEKSNLDPDQNADKNPQPNHQWDKNCNSDCQSNKNNNKIHQFGDLIVLRLFSVSCKI